MTWQERVDYFKKRQRCVRCGAQDAYTMNGHQRCYECTEISRQYSKHRREEKADIINEKQKTRYHELRDKGICVACGKKEAVGGRAMCQKCLQKIRNYYRKYSQERRNNDSTGTC